jgi:hypothetical protein
LNVYLASPSNRHDAEYLKGMSVLVSFAQWRKCIAEHIHTFRRVLVDSGAFSELTGKAKVDVAEYREWSEPWRMTADAIAGLDDIRGDWRRSLKNYEQIPWGFPTIHDTDPPELLSDLVSLARERGNWLGIGIKPPREGKERFVRWACDHIPDGIHIHGWALRRYTYIRRLDSVDSTNWMHQMIELKSLRQLEHLTTGECLEIIVKRYQRWRRVIQDEVPQGELELTA